VVVLLRSSSSRTGVQSSSSRAMLPDSQPGEHRVMAFRLDRAHHAFDDQRRNGRRRAGFLGVVDLPPERATFAPMLLQRRELEGVERGPREPPGSRWTIWGP